MKFKKNYSGVRNLTKRIKLCQSQLPPMTNKTVHIPQPQNAIGSCQCKEITKILQDFRKSSEL